MTATALGLLVLRSVVGVVLVGHGTQKLLGWFGGYGPRGTGALFDLLGYRPGTRFAVIAGLTELGSGALLAVGFLTPLACAGVIGVMLNAAWSLRRQGPWVANGGWEYTFVLAVIGATLALVGPGSVSIDHTVGLAWPTPWGPAGIVFGAGAAVATVQHQRLLAERRSAGTVEVSR